MFRVFPPHLLTFTFTAGGTWGLAPPELNQERLLARGCYRQTGWSVYVPKPLNNLDFHATTSPGFTTVQEREKVQRVEENVLFVSEETGARRRNATLAQVDSKYN